MIKLIVFDADNTLYKVRVRNAYDKKFGFLSEKTGIEGEMLESEWTSIVKRVSCLSDPKKRSREYSVKKSLINLGVRSGEAARLAKASLKIFWRQTCKDLKTYPMTMRTIKKLCNDHILVVASDEFRKNLEMKLNRLTGNWKRYFNFLVTPEDTGAMKPSGRYYQAILKKTKLRPEEILVVGDSQERDLNEASKLGMSTLLIKRPGVVPYDKLARTIDNQRRKG